MSCGRVLQFVGLALAQWQLLCGLFFCGPGFKFYLHIVLIWVLLQREWVSDSFRAMQRTKLCTWRPNCLHCVSSRCALQCVGLALAQWQLLCGLLFCWWNTDLLVLWCGDVSA